MRRIIEAKQPRKRTGGRPSALSKQSASDDTPIEALIRQRLGPVSRREIFRRGGPHYDQIGYLIRFGRRLRASTLAKLARVLGVTDLLVSVAAEQTVAIVRGRS